MFSNTPKSYDGYTLFEGYQGDTIYLIDNCGKMVNKWVSNYRSNRNPSHLLADGSVLHAGKVSTHFASGAGRIERIAWNGNLMWHYEISDSIHATHHDFIPMPKGNILVTVWEEKTVADQVAAGRTGATGALWIDKLVELKPIGIDSAVVVWQWSMWDHLVQNVDPTLSNFGSIPDHPELINANALPTNIGSWSHVNSLDYNDKLDQIMLCSRNFDEIFIIDHSTTTAEASGHTGGNSGKGGDFLYRWGNPINYGRGQVSDKQLYHQHGAHWIPSGKPHAGDILIYNNGITRVGSKFSTIVRFTPPVQVNGSYTLPTGQAFGPNTQWIYPSVPDTTFYSSTQGSVQMMPNGNLLINEANSGDFQEIDSTLHLVWRYVAPITPAGIDTQGQARGDNGIFKMRRYSAAYSAFDVNTPIAKTPIEINYYNYTCQTYPVLGIEDTKLNSTQITLYPNPAQGEVTISLQNAITTPVEITLTDITGRVVKREQINNSVQTVYKLNVSNIPSGFYLVKLVGKGMSYYNAKLQVQ